MAFSNLYEKNMMQWCMMWYFIYTNLSAPFSYFKLFYQMKADSADIVTDSSEKLGGLKQRKSFRTKLQQWSVRVFKVRIHLPSRSPCLHTHTHTHTQLDTVCQVNCGHYLSQVSWAIIATATKVCHVTLSDPVLWLSFPQPFFFSWPRFILPFLFPWKVHHPHRVSEWYLKNRSL